MCVEMVIANKQIQMKTSFEADGSIIVQDEKRRLLATEIDGEVYWSGLIQEEDVPSWTNGQWKRAEIVASRFNHRGRWYDVPPGQVIKGIAFITGERTILKIATREAIGKETDVQNRFTSTGKRLLIPR